MDRRQYRGHRIQSSLLGGSASYSLQFATVPHVSCPLSSWSFFFSPGISLGAIRFWNDPLLSLFPLPSIPHFCLYFQVL